MKYTIVDQYGEIISVLDIIPRDLPEYSGGNSVVQGAPPTLTSRYTLTQAGYQWMERPPQPTIDHFWDGSINGWRETRTVDSAKAAKKTKILEWRNDYEYSWFMWGALKFNADKDAQMRLQGALQLANMSIASNTNLAIDWTLYNGTVVTLTAPDFIAISQALASHVMSAHSIARTLLAQAEAATTLPEVDAVSWPEG